MKKILVSIALLAGITVATAQQQEVSTVSEGKNIIKTNLLAYGMKNINVNYERVVNKWFSVSVSSGYVPTGSISFINLFENRLKSDDQNQDLSFITNVKVGGTLLTLEPRFYVGKGYGKGFYFAPYYRYSRLNVSDMKFTHNINGQQIDLDFKGNFNAHNLGLMLGAQWFLGKQKNWVIDAWFVGAHYGISNGAINTPFNFNKYGPYKEAVKTQLKATIEKKKLPLIGSGTAALSDTEVNVSSNGNWAGVRFGLSVGYRF